MSIYVLLEAYGVVGKVGEIKGNVGSGVFQIQFILKVAQHAYNRLFAFRTNKCVNGIQFGQTLRIRREEDVVTHLPLTNHVQSLLQSI